jgi:DNA-binding transcriptional MerR regulator
MNHFSIKDIEHLCGIKAHTIRIWEQRYNIFCPKRKTSNHRVYDNEDLKELLRISFLYHNGYKISKIACLDKTEMNKLIEGTVVNACCNEVYIHRLMEAALDLDHERFDKLLHNSILRLGMDKSILEVFYPFLERVGRLWMTNHVIPAQEHFSSYLIQKKIIAAIDGMGAAEDNHYRVGIFSFPGEFHEIPLLIANYFFRSQKISTVYFGVDVSEESLQAYHAVKPFTHLYSHMITNFTGLQTTHCIGKLCQSFPATKVLISGPCTKDIPSYQKNLKMICSPADIITYAKFMREEIA